MELARLVGLARKVIESQKPRTGKPQIQSILRLEELLNLRTPSEDLGGIEAEILEVYPRFLNALRSPRPADLDGKIIIGVDSSSRPVELSTATLIVSSVSVSSNVRSMNWDWPQLYSDRGPVLDEPIIRVLPNSDEEPIIDDPMATSMNPAGKPYDPDYSQYQALDEARVSIENKALHALADILEGYSKGREAIVLVDGPIYLVPGVLAHGNGGVYVEAWRKLLEDRVSAVKRLLDAGARVYGIVKRIEKARIIERTSLPSSYTRCLGSPKGFTDRSLIYRAIESSCYRLTGMGRVLASPPVKVRSPGSIVKTIQYLVIPQPWHRPNPHASRYYRVEEPLEQWIQTDGRLDGYKSPVAGALMDSIARGSLEPVTIVWSDRRAKASTNYLRELLLRMATRMGVPLSYSEEHEEVVAVWQRAMV